VEVEAVVHLSEGNIGGCDWQSLKGDPLEAGIGLKRENMDSHFLEDNHQEFEPDPLFGDFRYIDGLDLLLEDLLPTRHELTASRLVVLEGDELVSVDLNDELSLVRACLADLFTFSAVPLGVLMVRRYMVPDMHDARRSHLEERTVDQSAEVDSRLVLDEAHSFIDGHDISFFQFKDETE